MNQIISSSVIVRIIILYVAVAIAVVSIIHLLM